MCPYATFENPNKINPFRTTCLSRETVYRVHILIEIVKMSKFLFEMNYIVKTDKG